MKQLLRKEIELKELSTVILKQNQPFPFYNTKTKKRGKYIFEVVSEKEKFIVIESLSNYGTGGFYAEYIEEDDALIVCNMGFNIQRKSWYEKGRLVLSRKENRSEKTGNTYFSGYTDITAYVYKNIRFPVPGYATAQVRKFFGGFYQNRNYRVIPLVNSNYYTEIMQIDIACSAPFITKIDVDDEQELKPLPQEAKRRAYELFAKMIIAGMKDEKLLEEGLRFIYLQNTGGTYIARQFGCCLTNLNLKDPSKFELDFFETMRVGITDIEETMKLLKGKALMAPLFYYDREGIENGCFKYYAAYLNRAVNRAKKACSDLSKQKNLTSMLFPELLTYMTCPLYEKICNSSYKNLKESFMEMVQQKFILKNKANTYVHTKSKNELKYAINEILGTVYWNKKPLHQMLGLPMCALQAADTVYYENRCCFFIKTLKDMYQYYPDYLQTMNKKSFNSLFLCLKRNFGKAIKIPIRIQESVCILIALYGPGNVEAYINFCAKHPDISSYYCYLKNALAIKDIAPRLEWRLRGTEMYRQLDFVQETASMFNNNKEYKNCKELYKEREKELAKYAYEKNGMMISWPKEPVDVIREGVLLHHCVKSFTVPVAEGKMTLLFIRKKSRPEKPFYTLELRDNKVRQCHGFGNKNIDANAKVEAFLKDFCSHFGITYSAGTGLLGL